MSFAFTTLFFCGCVSEASRGGHSLFYSDLGTTEFPSFFFQLILIKVRWLGLAKLPGPIELELSKRGGLSAEWGSRIQILDYINQ